MRPATRWAAPHGPLPGRRPLPPPESAMPPFSLGACRAALIVAYSTFRTPHFALRARCCLFATSYPQRLMPNSACQKPSNSHQNRSKRRRFPSKRHQKGAHFVMPILTFWGVTPSGASARAVLAFRKGKKARFGGAKWRPKKLSTIRKSYPQFERRGGRGMPPVPETLVVPHAGRDRTERWQRPAAASIIAAA